MIIVFQEDISVGAVSRCSVSTRQVKARLREGNQGWSRGGCGCVRIKGETFVVVGGGGVCLLSFDVGLNQGGAGPGSLFALFNTQCPSPSLFLSLHPPSLPHCIHVHNERSAKYNAC